MRRGGLVPNDTRRPLSYRLTVDRVVSRASYRETLRQGTSVGVTAGVQGSESPLQMFKGFLSDRVTCEPARPSVPPEGTLRCLSSLCNSPLR